MVRIKLFSSPKDLKAKIEKYFNDCEKKKIPVSITGLALALKTNRQTLINYANRDEYADLIANAKLRVENAYEIRLIENGRAGDIFALKNFGWTDKHEIEGNNGNNQN